MPCGVGGVPTGAGLVDGGGRPRALVAGEGWGGCRDDGSSKEEGGLKLAWLLQRGGGGARASVAGGVGGRGTGPRDGANFATCVVFLSFLTRQKKEKWLFLKDALWGGQGRVGLAGKGWVGTQQGWLGGRGVREAGQGLGGGGCKGFGSGGGVGGRRMSYSCRF